MSERGAHTTNIPSHPIVEYHHYTWEHCSQYNNNLLYISTNLGVDAGENPQPKVITTISTVEQKVLLNLQYEINPPLNSGINETIMI